MPRPGSKAFYGHQRDENEGEIVAALKAAGKFVTRVKSSDPAGCPDLIVITPGHDIPLFVVETIDQALDVAACDEPIALVEVKVEGKKLNSKQLDWHGEAILS